MGMSTHIVAFRPADEKWKQMKAIWDACKEAGVGVPEEVKQFFAWNRPDPNGVEVNIKDAIEEWRDDSAEGYQVDLTKLPKDVKYIRFYNSW